MDQINPFTNAPTNPPEPPPAVHVPPPAQQTKPAAPKTSAPKKKPSEIDIKHIIKTIVLVGIGIVVAKLAFDKEELSLSETFAAAKRTPRPATPAQTEPFVVNGVFLSEGGGTASAIVNNKVVEVGDTIDGGGQVHHGRRRRIDAR